MNDFLVSSARGNSNAGNEAREAVRLNPGDAPKLFQECPEHKASCSRDNLRDMRSHLRVVRKSPIAGIVMLPTDLPLIPARSRSRQRFAKRQLDRGESPWRLATHRWWIAVCP
jgi:hypothetical protein